MNELSTRLLKSIEKYKSELIAISSSTASEKPNPQKWSRKEFLGHLIDSAANNHQRFVRIQSQDELIFEGYDQDVWVAQQGYQNQKWDNVISLWYQYNRHLAQVINNIPEDILQRERKSHNLHQIAFKTVSQNQSTSLAYFIKDYIDHLEYHMGQVLDYPYS